MAGYETQESMLAQALVTLGTICHKKTGQSKNLNVQLTLNDLNNS